MKFSVGWLVTTVIYSTSSTTSLYISSSVKEQKYGVVIKG